MFNRKEQSLFRTRELVDVMKHREIIDIIPKCTFSGVKIGGNFPKYKKIDYKIFGYFLDKYISQQLQNKNNENIDIYNLFILCGGTGITREKFLNTDYYRNIDTFLKENFSECKKIECEPEWKYENILSHPDLVIDDTIYEIKTTGKFSSMRLYTKLQLLSYYTISKKLGKNIKYIGVYLPAQEKIIRYNISTWNYEPFYKYMKKMISLLSNRLTPSPKYIHVFKNEILGFIGTHVERKKSLYDTIKVLDPSVPYQIFLSGRTKTEIVNISEKDVEKTNSHINNFLYNVYVHAPYTFNLSRIDKDNYVVKCMKNFVEYTKNIGCKGIVIHCGIKRKDVEQKVAYENMLNSVIQISENTSEDCSLLIETSAGETGELLSHPEELVSFYYDIPETNRKNVKICVDSCHVYSAGYYPLDFVNILEKENVPIGLVHYNDSNNDIGCCKDEHKAIGFGYIGLEQLYKFGLYCIKNKIQMVHE